MFQRALKAEAARGSTHRRPPGSPPRQRSSMFRKHTLTRAGGLFGLVAIMLGLFAGSAAAWDHPDNGDCHGGGSGGGSHESPPPAEHHWPSSPPPESPPPAPPPAPVPTP